MKPEIWLIVAGSPNYLNTPKLSLLSPSKQYLCFPVYKRIKPRGVVVLLTFTTQTLASWQHQQVNLAGVVKLPDILQPCKNFGFFSVFSAKLLLAEEGEESVYPRWKGERGGQRSLEGAEMKNQFSVVMQSHSKIPQKGTPRVHFNQESFCSPSSWSKLGKNMRRGRTEIMTHLTNGCPWLVPLAWGNSLQQRE